MGCCAVSSSRQNCLLVYIFSFQTKTSVVKTKEKQGDFLPKKIMDHACRKKVSSLKCKVLEEGEMQLASCYVDMETNWLDKLA